MEVKGVDQWLLDFRQAAILRVTTLLQLAQMLGNLIKTFNQLP